MKFAIMAIAYHEERFIKPFVQHYRDLVDKILVLNSIVAYSGSPEGYDATGDIAESEGAVVIRDHWKTEHDQRNKGLELLSDYDLVFVLDPDEFFEREEFERYKKFIETAPFAAYQAKMHTYWKNGYRLEPQETYEPTVVVQPKVITFNNRRGIANDCYNTSFIYHHFSWARTDEEILRKVTHFSHAGDFDGVAWYENVWKKWTPESKNLHPIDSNKWLQAVPVTVPTELKKILDTLEGLRG